MNIHPECVPCMVQQAVAVLRRLDVPWSEGEPMVREVLRVVARGDYTQSSPVLARDVYGALHKMMGLADPFAEAKAEQNRRALDLIGPLERRVLADDDPFAAAVKLSLAGNTVDLGTAEQLDLDETVERLLSGLPDVDQTARLRRRADQGGPILFLADNAGEVVLDRPLITMLARRAELTVAVRGGPIINDATVEDARRAGLDRIDGVTLIDSGVALPGTRPELSSPALRRALDRAALVVSKGQGNFETLCDEIHLPLCFLFMVKCHVVARHTGLASGSSVVAFVDSLSAGSAGVLAAT